MDNNKIRSIKIILIIVISFFTFSLTFVSALDWSGSTAGNGEEMAGCGNNVYACYSGVGLRFTLYRYDGKKATKLGKSYDIWKNDENFPNPAKGMVKYKIKGKTVTVKYSDPTHSTDAVNMKHSNNQNINKSIFTLTNSQYKEKKQYSTESFTNYIDNSQKFIDNYLTKGSNKNLINEYFGTEKKINDHLGYTISGDVSNYYLVVETLYQITYKGPDLKQNGGYWKNKGDWDSPGVYIGTAFELSHIYDYFYEQYSTTLTTIGNIGKFVNSKNGFLKPATSRDNPFNAVKSNKMYGMAAYSLSDYIEPSCDCSSAKNEYSCAMDYCDTHASESGRKDCVTKTCGVKDPGFSSCGNDEKKSGDATNCASSANATNKTCTIGNDDNYYKTTCSETNNVFYNDSLPTSIEPGMGFSYSLLLSGTKTCNTSFEVNKWNFDYAVATKNERETLDNKLDGYKNLSKESLGKYQYNSSNAEITIDIEEKVEKEKNAKKITKKLKDFADILKKDIKVSDLKGSSNTFQVISKNQKFYEKTFYNKTFTSSMSSIYSLPDVCIDGASGKVYDAKYDDLTKKYICNKNSDGPYTKYFTNLKASIGINDTTVTINKNSSKIENLKNICYYQVEDEPLSCVISKSGNTYSLKVYSEYNIDYTKLRYSLSTNPNANTWSSAATSDNTLTRIDMPNNSFTLYGKVKYEGNDDMITICSIQQPKKTTGEQCTVKYQPTEYDEIAKYCKSNWHTDKDSYISEKACYNACTGLDSCKVKYSCNDTTNIESYCKSKYNPVTKANYYRACINDCSCSGGNAVYRPISLSNPFPNKRLPGANWQGYEKNIGDGSETNKAEYVVQLSASDIENIKNQTEKYNTGSKNAYIDYVWADKSDKDGKYISKFIHDTGSGGFTNLFCIIQGEGSCK